MSRPSGRWHRSELGDDSETEGSPRNVNDRYSAVCTDSSNSGVKSFVTQYSILLFRTPDPERPAEETGHLFIVVFVVVPGQDDTAIESGH